MTAWGLTGGRRKAVLAVVSGTCMALSACAAATTGDTPGEPQRAAIPPVDGVRSLNEFEERIESRA